MRAVVQRVSSAQVTVAGQVVGQIGRGFLVLVGISPSDGEAEAHYLARKIAGLRVFEDDDGKMNRGLAEIDGERLTAGDGLQIDQTAPDIRWLTDGQALHFDLA